jgi:hypothetical protein
MGVNCDRVGAGVDALHEIIVLRYRIGATPGTVHVIANRNPGYRSHRDYAWGCTVGCYRKWPSMIYVLLRVELVHVRYG